MSESERIAPEQKQESVGDILARIFTSIGRLLLTVVACLALLLFVVFVGFLTSGMSLAEILGYFAIASALIVGFVGVGLFIVFFLVACVSLIVKSAVSRFWTMSTVQHVVLNIFLTVAVFWLFFEISEYRESLKFTSLSAIVVSVLYVVPFFRAGLLLTEPGKEAPVEITSSDSAAGESNTL